MHVWDPSQYLRFGDERLRPALDLLSRVQLTAPTIIYDLGCGAGTSTVVLKERWPEAEVTGIDSSASMLDRARALDVEITWREDDLTTWEPDAPCDLLFSNAVFHWLDDHEALFQRLVSGLGPGGVLAVQMPGNYSAPTHTAIAETVQEGPWRECLEPHLREWPVHDLSGYYDLLTSHTTSVDLWETTYAHVLEGDHPVVEWLKGSALRPLLDLLDEAEEQAFLKAYGARAGQAYPRRQDGKTVMPFKRLFFVAVRGGGGSPSGRLLYLLRQAGGIKVKLTNGRKRQLPDGRAGVGRWACSVYKRWTAISAPDRIRTCDPLLRRQPLYPLSYWGAKQHKCINGWLD